VRRHRATTGLHAHIAQHSSDCDGPTGLDWVEEFSTDEAHEAALTEDAMRAGLGHSVYGGDFSDLHFKQRVLELTVTLHQDPGCESVVRITDDGFSVHRQTDEGFNRFEVRWCEDRCNAEESSAYDRFAEAMGY
jgi:hypothetical protein